MSTRIRIKDTNITIRISITIRAISDVTGTNIVTIRTRTRFDRVFRVLRDNDTTINITGTRVTIGARIRRDRIIRSVDSHTTSSTADLEITGIRYYSFRIFYEPMTLFTRARSSKQTIERKIM